MGKRWCDEKAEGRIIHRGPTNGSRGDGNAKLVGVRRGGMTTIFRKGGRPKKRKKGRNEMDLRLNLPIGGEKKKRGGP